MTTLNEAITEAKKVMAANNLTFATIWKTGKSYGFNFDKQTVGFTTKEYGVKRTVVSVI
jgi:membrane carboxypeptidase/penicillin-binding protein PbpC